MLMFYKLLCIFVDSITCSREADIIFVLDANIDESLAFLFESAQYCLVLEPYVALKIYQTCSCHRSLV